MAGFLTGLFILTLTMGAVIALLLALGPLVRRRFRPQWRYWAWLLVALRLAVPFNVSLPQAPVRLEAPAQAVQAQAPVVRPGAVIPVVPSKASDTLPTPARALSAAELLFGLWAAGAAAVLLVQLGRYAAFRRRTGRWCVPAGAYEGTPVCTCALLSTPVLVGLIRPRILLPEGLEGEERAFALAHEAAHLRRHDLWYKLLLIWVRAIHWFDPLVWIMARAAERDLEICCDAVVLAGKDRDWRRRYGAALLALVPVRRAAPLTSQFAGGLPALKERFRALADTAPKRAGRLALALVLGAALLGGGLVACTERAPEAGRPSPPVETEGPEDGIYWCQIGSMDWLEQEEIGQLSLALMDVEPETLSLKGGTGETMTLPLEEDVTLGNHGDKGLKEFLMWSLYSSHAPVVLEVEVEQGFITAMTWRDAVYATETVQAVVHQVDVAARTITYAVDDGNVGADSQWIQASVSSAVDLESLAELVNPRSDWGQPCTLEVQAGVVVELRTAEL